jgi:single-stranded DNA-binding protein
MSYEKITIVGNIGEPELLYSSKENPYIRMPVAVSRVVGGNRTAVWYSVLLFGSMVREPEKLLARYTKGRLILVEGRPQVEAFIRRDGSPGLDNTIVASAYPELLDTPKKS